MIENTFDIFISFLGYTLILAASLQTAIQFVKPALEPVKVKLYEAGRSREYDYAFQVFRVVLTTIAFFTMWGGVDTARVYLSGLPFVPSDFVITVTTVLLTVLGQEVIHPIIDFLYRGKEIYVEVVEALEEGNQSPTNG